MTKVIPLAAMARSEGFEFLDRLIEEWEDGTNRFEKPGEVILGVWLGDELVGTGGLTVQRENVARVRRVYVHPEHRKRGIATLLMHSVLARARAHFAVAVLFTDTLEASTLYERLGFEPDNSDGPDHATHRMHFAKVA